jgi:hypothetical protein
MSKQKARRRAEERARRRAPKPSAGRSRTSEGTDGTQSARPRTDKKVRQRSAREQRRRNRMIAVIAVWGVANALIFLLTDTWSARWLGLTITTILVPVVVWLLWDPEGRVDL